MNEHNRVIELLYDDKQIIITPADLERQGLNMIGHYGFGFAYILFKNQNGIQY